MGKAGNCALESDKDNFHWSGTVEKVKVEAM
jgi:hypothetical protein